MRTGIYAGTFDPVTFGHLDIARRAAPLFDRFILAIAEDSKKKTTFSAAERKGLVAASLDPADGIEIEIFSGLTIQYARRFENPALVRGLRAHSDFEYEFQLALLNQRQDPGIQTVFLITRLDLTFISSSATKELARLGGNLKGIVPECVRDALERKFGANGTGL